MEDKQIIQHLILGKQNAYELN